MSNFDLSKIQWQKDKKDLLKTEIKISKEKKRNPGGRPKKDRDKRLRKKITVNFTGSEFKKLEEKAMNDFDFPVPVSTLIRNLLKKHGEL